MRTFENTMAREAAGAPDAAARQLERLGSQLASIADRLRERNPRFVVTGARGSSDHAATYGKYLIETHLGLPVASIGPSVASLYKAPLQLQDGVFIAVSRSGEGQDLLRLTESARKGGALVLALVGEENSQLARLADIVLPLCNAPETSVTATKSYLTSMLAFLQLVGHWGSNKPLLRQAEAVPAVLAKASALDWYAPLSRLTRSHGLYVIGRGFGAAAALEMAQKCQELCRLHANAYSAAELLHGPLAVVGPGFPVLALTQNDATLDITRHAIQSLLRLGAEVITNDPGHARAVTLPTNAKLAPEVAPLALIQSFYLAIPEIAADRGLNPDAPLNLSRMPDTV